MDYTSDSDSNISESPDESMSPEKAGNHDSLATPRLRRIKGVDFPRSRRINFDLPEDEENSECLV